MEKNNNNPKTSLGRKVQNKEITNIDEILVKGKTILEPELVDELLELETDLLLIGQSKGKFGGGQRRVFKQTQKKTREGNKPRFATLAVVGDRNGHVGMGYGKSKETVLAREKAIRKAKLNIFTIRRGSGSWESQSSEPHSIPFATEGKCGSVIIKLMPAPKGTGLCIEKECAKVLELAGIQDVWSKTFGQTKNKINLIKALEKALRCLIKTKIQSKHTESLFLLDGSQEKQESELKQEEFKKEKGSKSQKTDKTSKIIKEQKEKSEDIKSKKEESDIVEKQTVQEKKDKK